MTMPDPRTMADVAVAARSRDVLGEVPLWDTATGCLWWTDIEGRVLQRLDTADGSVTRWPLPERLGSFALRQAGGLVCAFASGFAFLDPDDGAITWIARPEAGTPRNRFNDGKTDRAGRFWAGSMDDRLSERTGALYRLDPDLSVHRMEEGIGISNALCWSPDDTRFYFADTMQQTIWSYAYDAATGALADRRVFATTHDQPGQPDGSTVDAEGCVWNAQWDGWRLVRYDPDGRIVKVIPLPVQKPTSVMFGGPDLATLYVTTAIWDLTGEALAAQPLAGSLLALDVGVRGLPETRFAG